MILFKQQYFKSGSAIEYKTQNADTWTPGKIIHQAGLVKIAGKTKTYTAQQIHSIRPAPTKKKTKKKTKA